MDKLTFEQLPEAISRLTVDIAELKLMITSSKEVATQEQHEEFLSIKEAAHFLSLTVATIYSKVSKRELPFMKRSKRLYFSKKELTDYLKKGRFSTDIEINKIAKSYIQHSK